MVEEKLGSHDHRQSNNDYYQRGLPQQPQSAFGDEECSTNPIISDAELWWTAHVTADAKILYCNLHLTSPLAPDSHQRISLHLYYKSADRKTITSTSEKAFWRI